MKSWQAAHMRMLETLPKRTHYKRQPTERSAGGRDPQAVVVDGIRYETLTAAAKALATTRMRICNMARRGEAFFD